MTGAAVCSAGADADIGGQQWLAAADDVREFDETTLDRLDAACDRADEINARLAALLDGSDAVLGQGRKCG